MLGPPIEIACILNYQFCGATQQGLSRKGETTPVSDATTTTPSPSPSSSSSTPADGGASLTATPAPPSHCKLVLSGGEGYVDFRMGNESLHREEEDCGPDPGPMEDPKGDSSNKLDRSHLIVWQVTTPTPTPTPAS
ncbi:hypothetical protein ACOMHN_053182 [Nucella lapillus]